MSTFAHMNTKLVFNPTLKVELPPNWSQLFLDDTLPRTDTSLRGIQREIHHRTDAHARFHGEVWSISADANNLPTPYQQVVSGSVQMYVVSGVDAVQKNGKEIFIRPGEKISFHAQDTFSFGRHRDGKVVVLNEGAHFIECSAPSPAQKLKSPSSVEIEAIRAALGLHDTHSSRIPYRSSQNEETSSRAYRGNRRPY